MTARRSSSCPASPPTPSISNGIPGLDPARGDRQGRSARPSAAHGDRASGARPRGCGERARDRFLARHPEGRALRRFPGFRVLAHGDRGRAPQRRLRAGGHAERRRISRPTSSGRKALLEAEAGPRAHERGSSPTRSRSMPPGSPAPRPGRLAGRRGSTRRASTSSPGTVRPGSPSRSASRPLRSLRRMLKALADEARVPLAAIETRGTRARRLTLRRSFDRRVSRVDGDACGLQREWPGRPTAAAATARMNGDQEEHSVDNIGVFNGAHGAEAFGFRNLKRVFWNLEAPALYEQSPSRAARRSSPRAARSSPRPACIPGRSPKDKFVVRDADDRGQRLVGQQRRHHAGAVRRAPRRTSSPTRRAGSCSPRTSTAAPIRATACGRGSSPSSPGTRCSSATC